MRRQWHRQYTFLSWQAVTLITGNYVGWSTIFREVHNYCNQRGGNLWNLTNFKGNLTANPLISPCFWGSIIFLIALVWTISLLMESNLATVQSHIQKMWWLLLAGTLFALINNLPIIYKFYTRPLGSFSSCSAGVVTNPFLTSCFLGFSAFALSFILITFAKHAKR